MKKLNWTLIGEVSGDFSAGHVCTELGEEHEPVVISWGCQQRGVGATEQKQQ